MADYTKQIFEMLGLKPNEKFKIKGVLGFSYRLTNKLSLYCCDDETKKWFPVISNKDFIRILTGYFEIEKSPKPTEIEQLAIDYAKACGCKWMAKDQDRKIIAYSCRPRKNEINVYWVCDSTSDLKLVLIDLEISFIHSEDEEPFYIGG